MLARKNRHQTAIKKTNKKIRKPRNFIANILKQINNNLSNQQNFLR